MSNGTLNGNDIITKDNLELVKDYLNSNFPSIDVNCELKDDQMFLEFSGQKFLLDPNTKVNDLIYSFNQYVGNDTSSAPVIQDSTVDNRTYDSRTRRNRVAVKQYRIDIDEDLYNGVCSSLSSLSSSIATAGASYDASMLTGKLAKFYNGLGVTNENITSAKTMVEDIGLKVKYCLELYKSTDKELQYFFNQTTGVIRFIWKYYTIICVY